MYAKALLLLSVVAVLAVGCAQQHTTAPPVLPHSLVGPSVPVIQLPGGGRRATLVQGQLRFSAEVTSTSVPTRQGISVKLTLTNTGTTPVAWDDLRLGWEAATPDVGRLFMNLGQSHGGPSLPHPLTLAPGASTSRVVGMGPMNPIGDYHVVGGFDGVGGPSGRTAEILVRLTK